MRKCLYFLFLLVSLTGCAKQWHKTPEYQIWTAQQDDLCSEERLKAVNEKMNYTLGQHNSYESYKKQCEENSVFLNDLKAKNVDQKQKPVIIFPKISTIDNSGVITWKTNNTPSRHLNIWENSPYKQCEAEQFIASKKELKACDSLNKKSKRKRARKIKEMLNCINALGDIDAKLKNRLKAMDLKKQAEFALFREKIGFIPNKYIAKPSQVKKANNIEKEFSAGSSSKNVNPRARGRAMKRYRNGKGKGGGKGTSDNLESAYLQMIFSVNSAKPATRVVPKKTGLDKLSHLITIQKDVCTVTANHYKKIAKTFSDDLNKQSSSVTKNIYKRCKRGDETKKDNTSKRINAIDRAIKACNTAKTAKWQKQARDTSVTKQSKEKLESFIKELYETAAALQKEKQKIQNSKEYKKAQKEIEKQKRLRQKQLKKKAKNCRKCWKKCDQMRWGYPGCVGICGGRNWSGHPCDF